MDRPNRSRQCRHYAYLMLLIALFLGYFPAAAAADTVQIVTLNLYHDKDDWPSRRVQIVEKLKQLQPDVIALQEVIQRESLINQAEWLAGQLGYQWHFTSTDPADKPQRYGNAVLTRHPILGRGQKFLRPLDDSRTAAFLRIDLGGRTLNVYATHLHWTDGGGAIRVRQVADLMEYIAATSEGLPSIVAGDFNSTADSPELALLRENFIDAYGGQHSDANSITSSTLNLKYFAPKRIDHIFYQRGVFQPVLSEIILNQADAQGVWASDHYGMHAELRFDAANSATRPGTDPHQP